MYVGMIEAPSAYRIHRHLQVSMVSSTPLKTARVTQGKSVPNFDLTLVLGRRYRSSPCYKDWTGNVFRSKLDKKYVPKEGWI